MTRRSIADIAARADEFADAFEDRYIRQGEYENRTVKETLELGWDLLTMVPTKELKRIRDAYIEKYLKPLLEKKAEQGAKA